MYHDYTPEELRSALHSAALSRAGLNISNIILEPEAWTESHLADLRAVLTALPERSVEAWIAAAPEDLVEGDTYRVRSVEESWEVILPVTQDMVHYPKGWTPEAPTVHPHATAVHHPRTGQRYSFSDVVLHADIVLEKAEKAYYVMTVEEAVHTLQTLVEEQIHPLHLMAFIKRGDLKVYTYGNNIVINTVHIQDFLVARAAGQAILDEAFREDSRKV